MQLNVNGQSYDVPDAPDRVLLWVLRDELGLIGTRFGCGVGICGSCTLHVDGKATRACITSLSAVEGKTVTTIEGLADGGRLHPVQEAFLDLQVPQCGWCMSGQIMTAAAFLDGSGESGGSRGASGAAASTEEVSQAMDRNYCRCGCYSRIREAIVQASESMVEAGVSDDSKSPSAKEDATSEVVA